MITFGYPWTTMSLTIDIRDPEFQDKFEVGTNIKVKTMMDGSLRTRRTTPANQHIILKFVEMTRTKALELVDFLIASQGKKVRYVDFNGVQWTGYITTDPNEILTYARGLGNESRKESNQIDIDFEGALLG